MISVQPKILTITIDEDTTDLNLTYTISTSTTPGDAVKDTLVADPVKDTEKVAKIFTQFLTDTNFKALYNTRLSTLKQLQPNIKNVLYRDFSKVKDLLNTLTEDQIKDFNTKAFIAIKEWYTSMSKIPRFNLNLSKILTPAGQSFTKKGTLYNESLKVNFDNLSHYILQSTSTVPANYVAPKSNTLDADIKQSDFLEKYIVIAPWSSQIFHWLEEYMANNKITALQASRQYFDFTGNSIVGYFRTKGGASNRTRKNKKTNYDSDE
jgi:hypothetical protein